MLASGRIPFTSPIGCCPAGRTLRVELRPSLHFRPHERRSANRWMAITTLTIRGRPLRDRRRRTHSAAAPAACMATQASFTHEGGERGRSCTRRGGARLPIARASLEPGLFLRRPRTTAPATLDRSTEDWSTILALDPEEASTSDAERRRRLRLDRAPEGTGQPSPRNWCWRRTSSSSPRPDASKMRRSRARRRRRSPHGHCRLPLVYRLGPRHHDQPRGPHARHRPACGSRLDPAHLRPLRADGLIPNYFPDGENEGLYHTADATLWFFHALDRYLETTGDRATLELLLPKLRDISTTTCAARVSASAWIRTTVCCARARKAISSRGWMRKWMIGWSRPAGERRSRSTRSGTMHSSCWKSGSPRRETKCGSQRYRGPCAPGTGFLQPTLLVAGEANTSTTSSMAKAVTSHACRPNQIFASPCAIRCSMKRTGATCWKRYVKDCSPPSGSDRLRSDHPDYKSRYFGDLRARDAAYHQGTVWAWLIGPFIDAWLKVHPEDRGRRAPLSGGFADAPYGPACVGSISEVFDAEPPFTPRGCIAQAWSVAEVLRCWVKTAE